MCEFTACLERSCDDERHGSPLVAAQTREQPNQLEVHTHADQAIMNKMRTCIPRNFNAAQLDCTAHPSELVLSTRPI